MANRVMAATQSYSAPTICDTGENVFTQHATTNITVSTTNLYTEAFTSTVGVEMTGVVVYPILVGSAGVVTAYLQEYDGAAWADVAGGVEGFTTINVTDLKPYSPLYLRYDASYTATTASVGYYRIRFVNAGAGGTTTFAANSAGTAISYVATNNVNTTTKPGTSDSVIVAGNKYAPITLTLDGTQTVGATLTSTASSTEIVGLRWTGGLKAMMVGYGATIQDDTAANVDFTFNADLVLYYGSKSYRGTTSVPYPSSRISKYTFNEGSTSGSVGLIKANGAIRNWVGMVKTGTSVTPRYYESGDGTAADPLITTGDIGEVGDEVIIFATSDNATNYNECEHRFIITKNSATSYVVSTTAGGAEAALTYVHTTAAKIINVEANVKVTTNSSSYGWFYQNWETTLQTNDISKDCQFEYTGSGLAYRQAYFVTNTAGGLGTLDYCKFVRRLGTNISFRSGAKTGLTFTGNISTGGVSTSTVAGFLFDSCANITCNDFVAADEKRVAISPTNAANIILNRFEMNACGKDGGITGTFYMSGGCYGWTVNDSNFNACRIQAIYLSNAVCDFNDCTFGTNGKSMTATGSNDITVTGYNTALFSDCDFGSDTLISGYLDQYARSSIAFDTRNLTANNHTWYTDKGSFQSTGAGLDDTTVRTADTLNLRMAPEDTSTGLIWEYLVLAVPGRTVEISGFIYENAAFVADGDASVTVELFLPGSTTADATKTMTKTTDEMSNDAAYVLGALYSGSINRYATVRITAKTTTASAYVYVADIKNGTNNIINFLTWYQGKPSPIMFEQLGDAQAVWQVQTSALTTLGTTGYNQAFQKILTGAVVAGADTSLTISAAGSTTDQTYYENIVTITSGPGAGQSRIIVDYDGVTKVATVDREWQVNPTAASSFAITPFSGIFLANAGRCPLAGGSTYIYLNSFASSLDNSYVDSSVYISAGTGAGQIRLITDYDGMTKAANVNTAWSVTPDSSSVYKIIPAGNTVTGSLTAAALEQIKRGVLATQLTRGGSYDFTDSLAQRMIDTDIKTDSMEVEQKNLPAYLTSLK